ncbi:MAG: gfo/Idh/MocA family oxidoreductase, partial [Planctomycetota bacterium]
LEGHVSAVLCHAANISYRLGWESSPQKIRETIQGSDEAVGTFERIEAHLAANEVDLQKTPAVLGPWLEIDTEKESFVGDFPSFWANELVRRDYREPFVVPDEV